MHSFATIKTKVALWRVSANKSKTINLKALKCSKKKKKKIVKTDNSAELCGNYVCIESSLQLIPHYTPRKSTHCYENGFQASSLTVNSLKKSSRGTALFLSAGLQKELNRRVCFGPSLKIVFSSKQVKKGCLFLARKKNMCLFKDGYFLQRDPLLARAHSLE